MNRFFYIVLFFLMACNTPGEKIKYKGLSYRQTLTNLFQSGRHDVNYTIHKEYTDNQKEVLKKFNVSLQANETWFNDLHDSLEKGKPFHYDKHLGINEAEFDTLLSIFSDHRFLAGKAKLTIINTENGIQFKGDGKLAMLDSLVLNFNDSTASYKTTMLSYNDTLKLPKNNLRDDEYLESPFAYKGPGGILGLMPGLAGNKYRLVIARVSKSGKTFLDLKGREYINDFPIDIRLSMEFE